MRITISGFNTKSPTVKAPGILAFAIDTSVTKIYESQKSTWLESNDLNGVNIIQVVDTAKPVKIFYYRIYEDDATNGQPNYTYSGTCQ